MFFASRTDISVDCTLRDVLAKLTWEDQSLYDI